MATTAPDQPGEFISERIAGGMLPRVLNTFDMVAIFVSIVLFITNAAVIQSAGPAAFGGWWPGVLVMVATGTVVLGYLGYVFPSTIGSASVQVQGVIIIGFIVVSAVVANQRFRLTQNIVNVVCVLYALAIGLVFLAGVVHLASGAAPATDPSDFSAWAPSADTGINLTNWSFFGLVVLALLGVEVPLNMGVEIKDQRSITRYLVWGSLAVMARYLLATGGLMGTVPATDRQSAPVTAH